MSGTSRPPPDDGGLIHISEVISAALDYRAPTYSPPYDSPIEDRFAYHAVKYLHQNVSFRPQRRVTTLWGRFRLDFAVRRGDMTIGVECDGRDYHQGPDSRRDLWRDAVILGTSSIDAIYRLRGSDIVRYPHDLLHLMADRDPNFFAERGRINLNRIASEEAVEQCRWSQDEEVSLITYRDDETQSIDHLILERRRFGVGGPSIGPSGVRFEELYEFACNHGPASLDEVRVSYWEQMDAA